MSKIRQTQLLLSAPWSPGFGGMGSHRGQVARAGRVEHYGAGSGPLWHGLSPPLACGVKQMVELD